MIANLIIRMFTISSRLIRWLLFNRLGMLLSSVVALGFVILVNIETLSKIYTLSRNWLLSELGIAWFAAVLWLTAMLITLRFHPRFLLRHWHRAIGALTLTIPLTVILTRFNASLTSQGLTNLGGDLGQRLAGPTLLSATTITICGMFISFWLMGPRQINWITRVVVRLSSRGIITVTKRTARLYTKTRPERYLGRIFIVSVIMLARSIFLLATHFRKAKDANSYGLQKSPAIPQFRNFPTAESPIQLELTQTNNGLSLTEGTEIENLQEAKEAAARMIIQLDKKALVARSETDIESRIRATSLPADKISQDANLRFTGMPFSDNREQALSSPTPPTSKTTISNATQNWDLPPIKFLHESAYTQMDDQSNKEKAQLIEETLGEYGIEVQIQQIWPGPTVTMFGLAPGWVRHPSASRQKSGDNNDSPRSNERKTRVKVDSILAREKDLALALAAPSIRFEAPVPGESVVGIEVPNQRPSLVTLRSAMENSEFEKIASKSPLAIALGTGTGGQPVVIDLAKMPHLLIAGSTGSGKSVCLNSIISGMLFRASPMELRMLLVDPKRVELTPFNGIPHLLAPVIVETDRVVSYLKGMLREMDRRYRAMEIVGVRNIEGYNASAPPNGRMPYLLVGIDELADLMMRAAYDVEHTVCRLAQLGRATGIHLVVATQRPSVDVVTGLIKANFPSRISFNVTSQIDSRTILDGVGAEKLLGKGDMLFLPPDAPKPRRVQGTFISDDEIKELVSFWTTQKGPPVPKIDLSDPQTEDVEMGSDHLDEMFERAAQMASSNRHLSTSLLQRRLRIGYPRAARLREQLESEGIISPNGEIIISE